MFDKSKYWQISMDWLTAVLHIRTLLLEYLKHMNKETWSETGFNIFLICNCHSHVNKYRIYVYFGNHVETYFPHI